jgi:hypothetical protein
MAVLTKWWKNAKENEGMHMILRKHLSFDKVGVNFFGSTSVESISHACRCASLWLCSTMDPRRKDVKIIRNSML